MNVEKQFKEYLDEVIMDLRHHMVKRANSPLDETRTIVIIAWLREIRDYLEDLDRESI